MVCGTLGDVHILRSDLLSFTCFQLVHSSVSQCLIVSMTTALMQIVYHSIHNTQLQKTIVMCSAYLRSRSSWSLCSLSACLSLWCNSAAAAPYRETCVRQ